MFLRFLREWREIGIQKFQCRYGAGFTSPVCLASTRWFLFELWARQRGQMALDQRWIIVAKFEIAHDKSEILRETINDSVLCRSRNVKLHTSLSAFSMEEKYCRHMENLVKYFLAIAVIPPKPDQWTTSHWSTILIAAQGECTEENIFCLPPTTIQYTTLGLAKKCASGVLWHQSVGVLKV